MASSPADISSTKAALEALRALQRKIGRLENERSSALAEASELRLQFETASASAAHDSEVQAAKVAALERSHAAREGRLVKEREDVARRLDAAETARLALERECAGLRERSERLAGDLTEATSRFRAATRALDAERSERRREALEGRGDAEAGAAKREALEAQLALLSGKLVQVELRNESLESALRECRALNAAA